MNYIDRGIIKWQPFRSLATFFNQVENLVDEEIITPQDAKLFDQLLEKYAQVEYSSFEDVYFCIDVKSFYASCELVSRNLDVYKTKLSVVGDINNTGSIIMANSHALKQEYNIGNIMRYYELQKILTKNNDQDTIIADTNMSKFVNYSVNLTKVLLNLISKEDIFHYSIDELFIHYSPYQNMYGKNHVAFALALKAFIFTKTGLPLVIGIGKNMVSSKFVLDIFAKKSSLNVAEMNSTNYEKFLKINKLEELWGVGSKIVKRLEKLRIYSTLHLANAQDTLLYKEFGIIGLELKRHVQLIDFSTWKQTNNNINIRSQILSDLVPKQKSIGEGQTLFRDYNEEEIKVIIHDLCLKNLLKVTSQNLMIKQIHLSIRYSNKSKLSNLGFSRQKSLQQHTIDLKTVYQEVVQLFSTHYVKGAKIRMISLSFGKLVKNSFYKNEVLDVINFYQDEKQVKIYYASQLLEESNYINRHTKIGGHKS